MTVKDELPRQKGDDLGAIGKKIRGIIRKETGAKLNPLEQKRIALSVDELFYDPKFRQMVGRLFQKSTSETTKSVKKTTTGLKNTIASLPRLAEPSDKQEGKKGFHKRFQQINETTIQETNEFGNTRLFRLNKEKGVWEVESSFPLKTELRVLGKDLFNVTEIDRGVRIETLYSPARKIQETFIRGLNGKDCLRERREDDLNGTSDHQFFDENERLIEERVSENNALRKLIIDGEVKFDTTKSSRPQLNKLIRKTNSMKR